MSKIEVDAITEQSGSTLTAGGGAGKTVVVDATTVTLGRCGGTVALASGATQSGFGRTGTVDWQTGSIKTATFTAANGEGYFANTAGGTFTMNLPAGVVGAIVSVQDYNNTFDSNALTVDADGTEKINGGDAGEPVELSTEGRGVTFVYVDATVGWRSVQDNDFTKGGVASTYICASVSGACNTLATVDTNFKVATFTGPGAFTVNSGVGPLAKVDYMVIAGGGGGGIGFGSGYCGGGGGAGGFRESYVCATSGPYTASPLAVATSLPLAPGSVTVTVGGGGPGRTGCSGNGNGPNVAAGTSGINSTFSSITSTGGGGGAGGGRDAKSVVGTGGSGGGGAYSNASPAGAGGVGNTPPVSPAQGTNGGAGPGTGNNSGGGGGGATAVGSSHGSPGVGGNGGAGATTSISGTPTARAGGGGGAGLSANTTGGTGGGGDGARNGPAVNGANGTANTGGGGGGGVNYSNGIGGNGGGGVVIIRYRFQ